jgi:thiopurine S-methyltransferase
MSSSEWERRWSEGRIGFHEDRVNWALEKYARAVFPDPTSRILVPLAGKSVDLRWLEARGHTVVGVELVELAVRSFFDEDGRTPEVQPLEGVQGTRFLAGRIEFFAANIFDVRRTHTGLAGGLFDRAALIALPQVERARYVEHLGTLLAPGAPLLLVTLDYDEGAMSGPPYRVPEEEVRALFAGRGEIEVLESRDALPSNPRFEERGLRRLVETVYRFTNGGGA